MVGERVRANNFALVLMTRSGERRLDGESGHGAGAQQRSPQSNARIAPIFARQTNHCASFAPEETRLGLKRRLTDKRKPNLVNNASGFVNHGMRNGCLTNPKNPHLLPFSEPSRRPAAPSPPPALGPPSRHRTARA